MAEATNNKLGVANGADKQEPTADEETYEDLVGNNLQNDADADRFDDVYMGVKKQYRPDWLTHENKIFVNKLNFVAKNYEQTHKSVSTKEPDFAFSDYFV